MCEEFMKSPVPDKLKGTVDEDYFIEELEANKFEMRERALPLLESTLNISYSNMIDDKWTDEIKDRIREIDYHCRPRPYPEPSRDWGRGVDLEYIDATERIKKLTARSDNELVNRMEVPDLLAQLKSMELLAKQRQEEEKESIDKFQHEFLKVENEVNKLDKEIFILGGGDEAIWNDAIAKKEVDKKAAEEALRKKKERR